jgi:oligopeptide transport system ATP-binding protein
VSEPVITVTGLAKRFRGRDRTEVTALAGVSLTVGPGQALGIVGESGSGKTTLARCLAALTVPTEGTIDVCGLSWAGRLDRDGHRRLARHLQLVFQDPYTSLNPRMRTSGLIGEGLRVHHLCRSRQEERSRVHALMNAVGLAPELAQRHPRELSGGQRQRVALARAQLADPAILLLDEATAALDLSAEAAVNRAISELTAARTTIVVAHRLTTAARADRIVVLDQGRIVETGSHAELVDADGTYAALWDAFTGESELVA